METERTFMTAESCISIHLVIEAYRNVYRKERVSVWLPDYFCDQTIQSFREEWMDFIYYPIGDDLEPQWDGVKSLKDNPDANAVDVFVFTHYFGVYHGIDRAKEFCKLNGAILIEDCAHVLYKYPKIGETGDFVIYSSHKQLPIPDGAVLEYNINPWTEKILDMAAFIKERYESIPRRNNDRKWYAKKGIQKLLPVHRRLTYVYGVHYGDGEEPFHQEERISSGSYKALYEYDYETIKRIAYIRRDNKSVYDYVMRQLDSDIEPVIPDECYAPYFAVYSLEKCKAPRKIAEEIKEQGFTVLHWPDLPTELKDIGGHDEAQRLSENLIALPIHQDIKTQDIVRKFCVAAKIDDSIGTEKLTVRWGEVDKAEWDALLSQTEVTNIPQDWTYGNVKEATEHWKVERAVILNSDSKPVGVVQLLLRMKMGVLYAVRVNRGPIFIHEYDQPEYHFMVMNEVRRRFPHPIPISYAPNVEFSPRALQLATRYRWRCVDAFGFPSAAVDLSLSEDELRKHLMAFWRKNLKHAERDVEIRLQEYDPSQVLRLYKEFLESKDIPGIPEHVLKHLFSLEDNPVVMLTAHDKDGEMVAYKGLYVHGNTGTSFIAWNTDKGRKLQARTLLIFRSALYLKSVGCKWYDLGGVDDITTEAVAKFKRGMNGNEYRLLGEFVRF